MNTRGRVLVVDDCPTDRAIMIKRLTSHGYEAVEAESGSAAVRLLTAETFDLVLLDIMMPDLDGIEVLKRIRLRHSALALPVVMLTAKDEPEDVVEALGLGANDYITKPVSMPVALAGGTPTRPQRRSRSASPHERGSR